MLLKLIKYASSQYIDRRGNMRGIKVSINGQTFTIFTSPLHPYKLEEEQNIYEYSGDRESLEDIMDFLNISSYEYEYGVAREIIGVYFSDAKNSVEFYIPVESEDSALEGHFRLLDLRESKSKDEYSVYEYHLLVSRILKEYTLYTFSLKATDPDERFDDSWWTVDPDWKYDPRLKSLDPDNKSVFKDGKLVYPSLEVAEACINYLYASLLNDRPGVMSIRNRKEFVRKFEYINDFTHRPSQLLFTSLGSLKNYIDSIPTTSTNMKTVSEFILDAKDPYYFHNETVFGGELVIIQNVYMDTPEEVRVTGLKRHLAYERAKKVVETWTLEKINLGYYPDIEYKEQKPKDFYDYSTSKEPFYIQDRGIVGKKDEDSISYYFAVLRI